MSRELLHTQGRLDPGHDSRKGASRGIYRQFTDKETKTREYQVQGKAKLEPGPRLQPNPCRALAGQQRNERRGNGLKSKSFTDLLT